MATPADKTNDDYWKRAVDALTGYTLADRKTLFDDMKGNHDIPLMYIWVDRNIRPVGTGYVPGFASSGGWQREGEDFLLPFYTMAKHGKGLDHNKAHITFIGAPVDSQGKDIHPAGGVYARAGKWTSKALKKSDGSHFTWDNSKFAQYSLGAGNALAQIANAPFSTRGFSHSGLAVDDSLAVHLPSFTEVALSFERVNRFLIAQSKVLADWEKRDIGEGSTEWAGSAASLFKHLVHRMNRNYEGYVEQLAPPGKGGTASVVLDGDVFTTYPGRTLAETQIAYREAARRLYDAWSRWQHLMGSPHRWLLDHLWDVYRQVLDNQMAFVDFETRGFMSYPVRTEGYKGYVEIGGRQMWLSEWDAWRAIGQEAVDRWQKSLDDALGAVAKEVIPKIDRTLADAVDAFPKQLTDKDTSSLSDTSVKEENRKLLDEQKKRLNGMGGNDELTQQALTHQKQVQEDYKKDREEGKKAQEEARKQSELDRAEARKYQDEARKQSELDRAEAQKYQDEARKQNEQDREAAKEEAKKAQEEARKQSELDRAEAEKYEEEARKQSELDRAEAEKYQEEARKQNEQDRAEAQSLAASSAGLSALANDQARAEAKKAQEEARKQSELDRAEAEKYEEEARKQSELDRAEAEKYEEEARKQSELDRAEAKKYEEQLRAANDGDLAAARALLDGSDLSAPSNADLQAEHQRETLQAQIARDAAEHLADQQEQDARADYERARADAQDSYEQAKQEADQARADAKAEYDNAIARGEDPQKAKEEYDKAVAAADQQQQAARAEADRDLAAARERYDQAMDDAATARQEAQEDYERQIADIDGKYDDLGLDLRTPEEIVRDRLSTLSEPYSSSSQGGDVYAPGTFDTGTYAPAGYVSSLPSGDVPAGTAEAVQAAAAWEDGTYGALGDGALGRNAASAGEAAATAAGAGAGAMAPGMYPPMGGMGGAPGGGQDQNGNGRQRNVLDSPIVRRSTRAGRAGDGGENAVPAARRVSTSAGVPFAPPMAGGNERGQRTSSDRARTAWATEEDDVWGTEEGGAPQALGR
ncbi:AAWKG family protein [Streptomyces sp. AC558_RSS880]|uniref:AAWKG family protein n=1 Tax=Streptomyces sp. AC558_RSS880 TaxID=2823687 RepID=UPI001C215581|nr:AAWKG family protein [Streptomyces sp. AC558_RSS880]